jgi:galactokinase
VAPERVTVFGPGRVNLIGEHTDYNQGLALPFAITEGVTVTATATRDSRIDARALDFGERDTFALAHPEPASGWRAFVRGTAAELQRAGWSLVGASLEISGTVPPGSGLSSSAALEVALALALLRLGGGPLPEGRQLARICSRVENEWVRARTGLLDQLASLYGRPHAALRIDFESLDIEPVMLELGDWRLVTLDSGERHRHTASGYNQRRAECARARQLLGLDSLRQASPDMLGRLPAPLDDRVCHVLNENARVQEGVAALERGDLAELGRLLDASHASLRDLFQVSTPGLESAVTRLREAGAAGARLMGGGFGGHALGLMPPGARPPPSGRGVWPGPGALLLIEGA